MGKFGDVSDFKRRGKGGVKKRPLGEDRRFVG